MYYTYILQSKKDKKYYIGQTNNIEKRLERHNNGYVKATRSRRPLSVIHLEEYTTRKEAMQREIYLKALKGNKEFKEIIS